MQRDLGCPQKGGGSRARYLRLIRIAAAIAAARAMTEVRSRPEATARPEMRTVHENVPSFSVTSYSTAESSCPSIGGPTPSAPESCSVSTSSPRLDSGWHTFGHFDLHDCVFNNPNQREASNLKEVGVS